jgi:hypothetical protein
VSDFDQRFYRDVDPANKVSEDFSFILDKIVESDKMQDLNLFFADTIVIKKGVVSYFLFNGEGGKVSGFKSGAPPVHRETKPTHFSGFDYIFCEKKGDDIQ